MLFLSLTQDQGNELVGLARLKLYRSGFPELVEYSLLQEACRFRIEVYMILHRKIRILDFSGITKGTIDTLGENRLNLYYKEIIIIVAKMVHKITNIKQLF